MDMIEGSIDRSILEQSINAHTNGHDGADEKRDSVSESSSDEEKKPTLVQTIFYHPIFGNFIMFVITANVLTLSLDQYPPPSDELQLILGICNIAFTAIFVVEMIIAHAAMGFIEYR